MAWDPDASHFTAAGDNLYLQVRLVERGEGIMGGLRLALSWIAFTIWLSCGCVSAQPVGDKINLALGSEFGDETPIGVTVKRIVQVINADKYSGLKIDISSNNANAFQDLGNQKIDIAIVSTKNLNEKLGGIFDIFDLPFLFSDSREALAVQKGDAGIEPLNELSKRGIIGISYMNNGINALLMRSVPQSIFEFKGKKIKLMGASESSAVSSLGAETIKKGKNESYKKIIGAVNNGKIDGFEYPVQIMNEIMNSNKERIYGESINLRPDVAVVIVKRDRWRALTHRAQQSIMNSFNEAASDSAQVAYARDVNAGMLSSNVENISPVIYKNQLNYIWMQNSSVANSTIYSDVIPIIDRVRQENKYIFPNNMDNINRNVQVAGSYDKYQEGKIGKKVYFITDRVADADEDPAHMMSARRGKVLYGVSEVLIDKNRPLGNIDKSNLLLESIRIFDKVQFESQIVSELHHQKVDDLIFYVHGYRNNFEDAIKSTAMMSSDISFGAIPILFSWPSDGTVLDYFGDGEQVIASRDNFTTSAKDLRKISGVKRVHVAAHSMGGRLLLESVSGFNKENSKKKSILFDYAILAAPDIYVDLFNNSANDFILRTRKTTIYASGSDYALKCSKSVNSRHRRLGDAENIILFRDIDTIDVTEAEPRPTVLGIPVSRAFGAFLYSGPCGYGHSYLMSSIRIQSDIQGIIKSNLPPSSRYGLVEKIKDGIKYWILHVAD